jgi:hypothetical protein
MGVNVAGACVSLSVEACVSLLMGRPVA